MEEDGEAIPLPTPISKIHSSVNQYLTLIEAWMPPFREKMLNKATNKTVTIPRWLDILAKKNNVNYSHLIQISLKEYLGGERKRQTPPLWQEKKISKLVN